MQRHDLDQRLAGLRDHEQLASRRLLDQARQMRLGFVDVDGLHHDYR